ncbi:MAG: hypothetical protein QNJ94_05025 [Alphaproteobacteria bacterium]|nr:hypothetical protein [Alphaproteobacteria bacterium]
MTLVRTTHEAAQAPDFGPTFFALAGFVREATAAPALPLAAVPAVRRSWISRAVVALIRKSPKVKDAPERSALSPTLGAIAGFVQVTTGGTPKI